MILEQRSDKNYIKHAGNDDSGLSHPEENFDFIVQSNYLRRRPGRPYRDLKDIEHEIEKFRSNPLIFRKKKNNLASAYYRRRKMENQGKMDKKLERLQLKNAKLKIKLFAYEKSIQGLRKFTKIEQ